MQVVVARRSGLFRGGDQRREPLGVERAREGGLLDPGDACAVQRPEVQPADLLQQRRHDVPPPELHGEPRGGEQSPAPARRLAQLGGASHRGDRDRDRAPPSCPFACGLELERDFLVLARQQRGAVPCAPVRLVVEHVRQRLVNTTAFRQAGALRDRRADERMPETQRPKTGVDDAGLDRRPGGVEIHGGAGDGGAHLEDLADPVLVAERGHQQEQPRRIRQIGHAVGERALEPLGQRQAAGHPLLVLVAADDRRELEDGERVPGRLAQDAGARPAGSSGAAASSNAAAVASSRPATTCSGSPASPSTEG